MIDCIPDAGGKTCIHCGWQWKRDTPFPRRNCSHAPNLVPAAARLGLTLDGIPAGMHQRLAAWMAHGHPERTAAERAAIATTPCDSRKEDGRCNATSCSGNTKKLHCAFLARLATESCPKGIFGDGRAAVRREIAAATA